MDYVYYILIPIITSILGGLIGGLFTYLGVKLTIKNERKIHEDETRLKIIEKNEEVIRNRPKLQAISNFTGSPSMKESIYLVPFDKPVLVNGRDIKFDYPTNLSNKENWEYYTIFLKNIGKKTIVRSMVHFENMENINLYTESEMNNWNNGIWSEHFYSDNRVLSGQLNPGEILELTIYYLKKTSALKTKLFDICFEDENGNDWIQYRINTIDNDITSFSVLSSEAYATYLRRDMSTFFLFQKLYWAKNIKKQFNFNKKEFEEKLAQQLDKWNEKQEEIYAYEQKVKNGKVELKREFRQF